MNDDALTRDDGDDRLSAWLDDELGPDERADLERELAADPALARELEALAAVRDRLRDAALPAPHPGVLDRIGAEVAADSGGGSAAPRPAPAGDVVVPLRRRTGWPRLVAAAAAFVLIVGAVVGGVGGSDTVPAVGDLVARHDAAAADEPMPDAVEMPMDEADAMGPAMPAALTMTDALHYDDPDVVHLVYRDGSGSMISVFRQDGDADLHGLDGGTMTAMGGTDLWMDTVDETPVAVVDGEGYVWTVVGADDEDTMMVAMDDDLPTRSAGVAERLRSMAEAVVEPWRLG